MAREPGAPQHRPERLVHSDDECLNKAEAAGTKQQKVNKLRRLVPTAPFGDVWPVTHRARNRNLKQIRKDQNQAKRHNVPPRTKGPVDQKIPLEKKIPTSTCPEINEFDSNLACFNVGKSANVSNTKATCPTQKDGQVGELPLQEGDCIGSDFKKYLVKRKLGAGGYGAVYHVLLDGDDKNKQQHYALKAEIRAPGTSNRLKMEVEVLRSIMKADKALTKHFTRMVDLGRVTEFAFVVLTLCGPSISSVRERVVQADFSHGTAIRIGIESLNALKDLHTIGYIHRDVKPSNLTIGLGTQFSTIYLIDFGIARRYLNEKGHIRLPRPTAKFCGTARFASRATHRNEDQCRHSDLESWFYLLMDLYNQQSLPWKRIKERDLILAMKDDIRTNEGRSRCIVELMPSEFRLLMIYVDSLRYESTPDYAYMRTLLEGTLQRLGLALNEAFDWEKYGPPPTDDD